MDSEDLQFEELDVAEAVGLSFHGFDLGCRSRGLCVLAVEGDFGLSEGMVILRCRPSVSSFWPHEAAGN